jgi:acetyl esterase/lipase
MKKSIIAATCAFGLLSFAGVGRADMSRPPPDVVKGIAALGPTLDRPMIAKTTELMKGLAPLTPPASVTVASDVAYGDDPLQKIDIYTPAKARNLPIAVFFHGGGFVIGDKKEFTNIPTYLSFAARICVRDGKCPAFVYLKGHNHISEMPSIGSADDQLARPLAEFVRAAH